MSAGQIAAPRIQVRPPLMAAALVATFAIGLGSGLVLPRALDSGGRSPAVAAAVTPSASNGYQLFRQGERADLAIPSAVDANRLFRQGERAP